MSQLFQLSRNNHIVKLIACISDHLSHSRITVALIKIYRYMARVSGVEIEHGVVVKCVWMRKQLNVMIF